MNNDHKNAPTTPDLPRRAAELRAAERRDNAHRRLDRAERAEHPSSAEPARTGPEALVGPRPEPLKIEAQEGQPEPIKPKVVGGGALVPNFIPPTGTTVTEPTERDRDRTKEGDRHPETQPLDPNAQPQPTRPLSTPSHQTTPEMPAPGPRTTDEPARNP